MKLNDVDVSLSLGQIFWKKQWLALSFFIMVAFIFPILTIFLCMLPILWDELMIFGIICANIFSILMLSFALYLIVGNHKKKKKIKIWLNDAVKLKAYSQNISEYNSVFNIKGIIIRVIFQFNGKRYIKESTVKNEMGNKAYLVTYKKYADRDIDILYSPKYDEVMILKDNISD